jgi:hypothetical protein
MGKDGIISFENHLGQYHRIDGPAVIDHNGNEYWYFNGSRHRIDGPAITYADGTCRWFLDDVEYTKVQWLDKLGKL